MTASYPRSLARQALAAAPIVLFLLVIGAGGLHSGNFLSVGNALQIIAQASPTIVVAVGMTFVLLTAGVDL